MELFLGFALFFLACFIVVYSRNKSSILGGFLFDIFLVFAGLLIAVAIAARGRAHSIFLILIAVAFLGVLFFGGYALFFFLLINARAVRRRESRSLSNSLTLIMALGLLLFAVVSGILTRTSAPAWIDACWYGLTSVLFFYLLHVLVFLTTAILCNFARPKLRQDYIIVLGSGLIDGKVPPLLAGRINRAIRFYKKQKAKTGYAPTLMMTGGQGSDEARPEGVAMAEYAMANGIPDTNLLVEDRACNTQQNMAYSKAMMDARSGRDNYYCIFATSRYHLLRAGIYAKRAGLRTEGIGAKTARYFVPNALIREYIAFLSLHKARFLVITVIIFALGAFAERTPQLLQYFYPEMLATPL